MHLSFLTGGQSNSASNLLYHFNDWNKHTTRNLSIFFQVQCTLDIVMRIKTTCATLSEKNQLSTNVTLRSSKDFGRRQVSVLEAASTIQDTELKSVMDRVCRQRVTNIRQESCFTSPNIFPSNLLLSQPLPHSES